MRTTHHKITKLQENEVFVFGSNLSGIHGGGAAKTALKWGAKSGIGLGHQGQTYALPTKSEGAERTLTIEEITPYTEAFILFAQASPALTFLVTEIGCGIAGYGPKDIAPLFKAATTVDNIHLPEKFWAILNAAIVTTGFKGFKNDMKCRDMQYTVGGTFEMPENKILKVCPSNSREGGLHFCENPLDVFAHYPPYSHENGLSKFAAVEGYGEAKKDSNGDSKVAVSKLFISAEITLGGLLTAGVKFILSKVNFKDAPATNTGDQSAATNTGYQSAATNTGYQSAATNTGYQSAATNTGTRSAATNTGDQSAATNTGYQSAATNTGTRSAATNTGTRSAATNTGDQSAATNTGDQSAATNTGDQSAATNTGTRSAATNTGYQSAATNTGYQSAATVEGKESVAISIGIEGKAKGALGCWLVLSEWERVDYEWARIDVQSFRIDGDTIKANTFYMLQGGKIIETT